MTQLMPVPVMNVRKMRVAVRDRQMHMRMRVRLVAVVRKIVRMLVMFVVPMPMRVLEWLVRVRVFMPFANVQPDPERHQHGRDPERRGRQRGQISSDSTTPNSGAIEKYAPVRAAEMTQCDDEHEADPVTAGPSASRQP